jgi:uncharacterized membrane protein
MDVVGSNGSPLPADTEEVASTAVDASIVVEASLADVYRRWLRIEEYPRFVHAIKSVRKLDPTHFAMQADLDGEAFDVILEIMLRVPDRRIAWRLLHDHLTTGVVSFASLGRSRTEIRLKIMSSSGRALAARVDGYLHQFKSVLERE